MNALEVLLSYVEGRMPHSEWLTWWASNAALVEQELGRFAALRISKRGFAGAAAVLEDAGVQFRATEGFCPACGEPMFKAVPGRTTSEEIRAFATWAQVAGKDEIVRSGWIHPGHYCPKGCTYLLHSVRQA